MTQADRDRLIALKKVKKNLITQREAAAELELSVRQVQRLLDGLKKEGDKAVVHGLRGKTSNRKIEEKTERSKRTRREDHALSHRPQMSSGRLFLDRVARQHCPSPLHRHTQNNTHPAEAQAEGDISTLPGNTTFLFCLDIWM